MVGGLRAWIGVVVTVALLGLGAGCNVTPDAGAESLTRRTVNTESGTWKFRTVADRVEARWRAHGDEGWGRPITVWRRRGWVAYSVGRGAVGADTAAVQILTTPQDTQPGMDDDEPDDGFDFGDDDAWQLVVCAARECAGAGPFTDLRSDGDVIPRGYDRGPQVSPVVPSAGDVALLGEADGRYVTWRDGKISQLDPRGLPEEQVLSVPLISPDGSLRVVSGVRDGDVCRHTLWSAVPGSADFAADLEFEAAPGVGDRSRGARECLTDLETFTDDVVLVNSDRWRATYLQQSDGGGTRCPSTQQGGCGSRGTAVARPSPRSPATHPGRVSRW